MRNKLSAVMFCVIGVVIGILVSSMSIVVGARPFPTPAPPPTCHDLCACQDDQLVCLEPVPTSRRAN